MTQQKDKYLQVRMSEEEKRVVDQLAKDYKLDVSSFTRAVMEYIRTERPVIKLVPEGK